MKIQDFEIAIDALNCDINIDEFKILKGKVRCCFAHRGRTLLMWDESGRAFSTPMFTEDEKEIDSDTHVNIPLECYRRDSGFDLKFE